MRTGRLVFIVVGVIFGVAALCVGGLLVAGYFFASKVNFTTVHDEQGREQAFKIETPLGRLRVDTRGHVDPHKLGIPLYPGATAATVDMTAARVDLDLDFADKSLRVMATELETPDPFDKVVAFYHEQAADFTFTQKGSEKAEFIWRQSGLKKIVGIRERGGKTRISLASIGEPEAN